MFGVIVLQILDILHICVSKPITKQGEPYLYHRQINFHKTAGTVAYKIG